MSLHCDANFQMRPEFYAWLRETLLFHGEVAADIPVVLNEVLGEHFESYRLTGEDEYRVFEYLMLRQFGVVVNMQARLLPW